MAAAQFRGGRGAAAVLALVVAAAQFGGGRGAAAVLALVVAGRGAVWWWPRRNLSSNESVVSAAQLYESIFYF